MCSVPVIKAATFNIDATVKQILPTGLSVTLIERLLASVEREVRDNLVIFCYLSDSVLSREKQVVTNNLPPIKAFEFIINKFATL